VIEVDFGKPVAAAKHEIVEAEIIEHIDLNSSRSEKETIHLALRFDGAAPAYEPGDSLDLYSANDPAESTKCSRPQASPVTKPSAPTASNRATSTRCR
jgi:sulfite reductase alpha subunit-like flavoprotein